MNLGVKALLSWVKATIPTEGEETDLNIEDLHTGEILLKLVCLLKKEDIPCLSNCVDDRFKIISDFIERDCRFNSLNGTPIIWKAIKDGSNVTTEIAKVLLLLVYHDMMNDHCTLRTLDCQVESQIASLTATYVMESEGSVSLRPGLDAHLSRRYLPVPRDIFDKSSSSSVSTVSSVYDQDESPLFVRSQKVKFLDLQNVASSSVSCSPIQDIMNTPIFQMRKMQRQLIQDRDYRDGLERELSNKLALLAQRESQINQLQYCLDKLKEDRGVGEQIAREQIDELENKNNMLQSRFNDVLKQNKELKGNAALMEHKVDELAEENGVLSSQMRTVCSQLAIFEAEVGRLTETQTSNEMEWRSTVNNLQSELNEARAQKELLAEQIEILQGKISCLEDKISRSTQEEEGDNMWISVEKELLENKICVLTDELENTTNSLQKIEVEVQAKTKQLKECEQEISDQKALLIQQQNQMGQLTESKNEAVEKLQKEMTEAREVLQQEICTLKLRLEEAEQQKHEQTARLHVQVASCTQEIENLKEVKQQKQNLLLQTEERVKDLMTKLYTANNLLADKDQEVSSLTEKVVLLTEMHQQAKDDVLAKEETFSRMLLEKSKDEEVLQSKIQSLKDQVNNLKSSLKQAEEELQMKEDLLSKTYQENGEQIEGLNRDIVLCKETIETLKEEIQSKDEQIIEVKNANMIQSERLQEEICALKSQISGLCESLSEAKQQVQTWQTELMKREEESSQQTGILQQELSSSEEMVKNLKAEIKTKMEQMSLLENQNYEESVLLKRELCDLQQQVASLKSQLIKAEEDLHLKENDFALKQQQVEGLQAKVSQFENEIKSLHANIQTKEEELLHLKKETAAEMERIKEENVKRSEEFENEIQHLSFQVQSLHESLNSVAEQLALKEGMLATKEMEISHESVIQKLKTTFDDEMLALRQQLHANEEQMVTIKKRADQQSNLHQQEMQSLRDQLDNMAEALSKAEEAVKTQQQIISEQEMKGTQEQESLQQKLSHVQDVIKKLENEISVKEQQMTELKTQSSEQSNVLYEQNENLQKQLESLASSLKDTQDKMLSKEVLLTQQLQENQLKQEELCGLKLKVAQAEKDMLAFKTENSQMHVNLQQKEDLLVKTKEQYQMVQAELSAIQIRVAENDKDVVKLREDAVAQTELIHRTKEQVKSKDNMLKELQDQSSRQIGDLQQCMEALKGRLEDCSQKLVVKEEQLLKLQLESAQQIDNLKRELVSLNAELNQHREMNTHVLRQKDETLESTQEERDTLIKEKENLNARIMAMEKQQDIMVLENQRLFQGKQVIERENDAVLKFQTKLQQELQMLKQDKDTLLIEKEKIEDNEVVKKDLLEQLTAKSTAVEHYKAQIEKAVDHYNSKKQLLQKSEEEVANLKHSLQVQESQVKTVTMENNLLQMELDKIQSNEKLLLNKVASLEAQLSFADKALRAQNKFQYDHKASILSTLELPSEKYDINTRTKLRSMSSDSLDQSSLDDSMNNTRKLSAPGESSTPLVRSSERLAAKRHVLQAESLETLYFTPISTRHRTTADSKPEESAKRDPASSVKRRRTTQVINITMTKKTPGRNEGDETFYSLTSARSQPNLSNVHKTQGISTELFTTPKAAEADQLIGLPGYRRSTIHSQATSTFCVGAENEPEGGPEDWMRIAEIQARNKACLPHLKSSYPLEFDTVRNSALIFTDEELRTGDPIETIRRASVMPGQLQDSVASHRLSYMGPSGHTATSRSRLSLMPGQAIPKAVSSTLRSPKSNKRAPSTLTIHPTSPEKKIRASCFPRPLTPKNRNASGPAIPHIQTTLSPGDRRQSMMFTIDNTPRKDPRKDILKKGLSKLRSSTRKSPGKNLKSPAPSANRRGQENIPTRNGRTAVGGAGRLGSQKSPLVANKGQRKSPQVSTRATKSPGLTASARKMISRMKV